MKCLTAVCAVLVTMVHPAMADELMTVKSPYGVMATLDRVEADAKAKGFFIAARVDHSGAAEKVGMKLRPTAVLIFGKPQGGTPLMQCDQRVGIDLPLKALAWQDEAGQVWLAMLDPAALKERYALGAECDAPIAAMRAAARVLLDGAVAKS